MFDDIYRKTLKYKEPSKKLISKTRERIIFEDDKKNRFKSIYTMGVLSLIALVVFIGENNSLADMKLAFDPENSYQEFLNIYGVINYLGKDVRPKYYTEDLQEYQDIIPEE